MCKYQHSIFENEYLNMYDVCNMYLNYACDYCICMVIPEAYTK